MVPLTYNLRSLTQRKATTAATALGLGLVVFVLAAALMLQQGIHDTMARSGSPDHAIVLRKGSDEEMSSGIEDPKVGMILAAPGVRKGSDGTGVGVGEVIVLVFLDKIGDVGGANVTVRGVPDHALEFHEGARIIEGRPARPGTDEVIVGKGIAGRFRGVELGKSFELRKNRQVTVVGIFEAGGSALESEVWGDLGTIRSSFGREGMVSSVRVQLESATAFDGFEAAVEQDKRLGLQVLREDTFYEKQSEGTALLMGAMGIIVAVFASIGAMIGAAITMYSAVANRQREIGVLRALGFSRPAILFSFWIEACIVATAGALIGATASLAMGFVRFSMMNFQTWSQVTFAFRATPQILVTAVLAGSLMGLLGGLFPALRAARTSIIGALKGE